MEELESKVRQLEILENIDLDKLLDELRSRDKKLSQLTEVERNLKSKVDAIYKLGELKVEEMKTKYLKEKKYKESAFARLEGLRMELRIIEGKTQAMIFGKRSEKSYSVSERNFKKKIKN